MNQLEGMTSPIFGARTLEQFNDNMGAIGWEMPQEVWNQLNEVSALEADYPNRFIDKFKRNI